MDQPGLLRASWTKVWDGTFCHSMRTPSHQLSMDMAVSRYRPTTILPWHIPAMPFQDYLREQFSNSMTSRLSASRQATKLQIPQDNNPGVGRTESEASQITIKAIVPSQEDLMNFSVSHALKASSLDSEAAVVDRWKPPPLDQNHHAITPSPQAKTSKPEHTDMAAVPSPRISSQDRQDVSPSSATPDKPHKLIKAITVTFRSRPALHRCTTHPAAMSMVRFGCC